MQANEWGNYIVDRLNWLADKLTEHQVGVLAIEAPFVRPGMAFIRKARRAFGLAAIVQMVAWRRECAFVELAAPTVRKAFCGTGRAEKHQVIAECKRRGWAPTDDNAADAIALLHVVPSRLEWADIASGERARAAA